MCKTRPDEVKLVKVEAGETAAICVGNEAFWKFHNITRVAQHVCDTPDDQPQVSVFTLVLHTVHRVKVSLHLSRRSVSLDRRCVPQFLRNLISRMPPLDSNVAAIAMKI